MFAIIWRSRESEEATTTASEREATATADKILGQLSVRYAMLKSYRDAGVVMSQKEGKAELEVELRFRTAFVRPARFRFSYTEEGSAQPKCIVQLGPQGARAWPGIDRREGTRASLDMGIAGATGVSRGTANTVPQLLLPDQISGRSLVAFLKGGRLTGEEMIRERPCFRIEHTDVRGDLTRVWVDKDRLLVLQLEKFLRIGDAVTREVTQYTPEADLEIPESDLVFDPPH